MNRQKPTKTDKASKRLKAWVEEHDTRDRHLYPYCEGGPAPTIDDIKILIKAYEESKPKPGTPPAGARVRRWPRFSRKYPERSDDLNPNFEE